LVQKFGTRHLAVPAHDIKPPIGQRSDRLASEMANLDARDRSLHGALRITQRTLRRIESARAIEADASTRMGSIASQALRCRPSPSARESI
jgi:hypothetical protein